MIHDLVQAFLLCVSLDVRFNPTAIHTLSVFVLFFFLKLHAFHVFSILINLLHLLHVKSCSDTLFHTRYFNLCLVTMVTHFP